MKKLLPAFGATALGSALLPEDAEAIRVGPKAKNWADIEGKFSTIVDKKVQAEISDVGSQYLKQPGDKFQPIADIFSHPELAQNYPELWKNIKVKKIPGTVSTYVNGEIAIAQDAPSKVGSMIHELQHAIQEKEDWPHGGGPVKAWVANKTLIRKLADEAIPEIRENEKRSKAYYDVAKDAYEKVKNLKHSDKNRINAISNEMFNNEMILQQRLSNADASSIYRRNQELAQEYERITGIDRMTLSDIGVHGSNYKKLKSGVDFLYADRANKWSTHKRNLDDFNSKDILRLREFVNRNKDYELYRAQIHEVDSFDTAARRKMTKEELLHKQPYDPGTRELDPSGRILSRKRYDFEPDDIIAVLPSDKEVKKWQGAFSPGQAKEMKRKTMVNKYEGGGVQETYGPEDLIAAAATGGTSLGAKAMAGLVDATLSFDFMPTQTEREPALMRNRMPEGTMEQITGGI